MVAGILVVTIGIALLAVIFGFFAGLPHISYYSSSNFVLTGITWLSGLLLVVIPILFLIFLLVRIFSDYRVKKRIRNTMIGTWIASIILFVFSGAFQIPNYANNSSITKLEKVEITNDLVKIDFDDFETDDMFMLSFGETFVNKYALFGNDVKVSIYKTDSAHVTIEKEISSQGRTGTSAKKYARQVDIDEKVNGNTIFIPEFYRIDKGKKYRGQKVEYHIYIPKDKKVNVARAMRYTVKKNEFEDE